jgi:PKD repeat protein
LAISGDAGTRTLFFEAEGYAGVTSNAIDVAATPNRTPVASFNANCVNLGCSFNSEASSDPDGSIVSWTWTFGDGGTDNARNPSHTYGAAGTYQVTLTVMDDAGATHSVTHGVTAAVPGPDNREPFADFNWFCEGLTCHFTDASSDRDGFIANRRWDFGDGATVGNELSPSHTYGAAGIYLVTLTVTDNGGLTSVSNDNVDPQAQTLEFRRQPSSSAASGVPFDRQPELRLRGGGRDIRQAGVVVSASIASGTGTLGGGTTATTDEDGRAQFADLSISGTGSFTLKFTAPGFGETTSSTIDLGKASSTTSITEVSPEPSIAGSVVTVKFVVSSAVGPTPTGSVTVKVTGSNPPAPCTVTLTDGAGTCQFTLNVVGDRIFTATYGGDGVHSGSEAQAPHRVDPVPPPPNQAPTARFTSSCAGLTCSFDGSGSTDPDGTVEQWSWNFGDGNSGSGATTSHTYTAGTYTVTLSVTDNGGATGTTSASVAPNQAPTAAFTVSCTDLTCSFVNGSSDPDPSGSIASQSWDFGDETQSNEVAPPPHTYGVANTYTVTLIVTDNQGATGQHQEQVTVNAPAPTEVRTSNR